MATAEINGIPIRYEDSGGDGPAVLFSHGFLMDHTMFDAQVEALAGGYRCIRWDGRGFGDTPAPEPFTYWDSAADAAALLDHLGVEEAVWVGMSQGGSLSLRGALTQPDQVRAIVLIDSEAGVDAPEVIEGYRGMVATFEGDDDDAAEAVFQIVAGLILGTEELAAQWIPKWRARRAAGTPMEHAAGALLGRDDITDRLGEIECPLLVIHGTADQAIPLAHGTAVEAAVPDGRGVVEVDGAAHAPNMSHPEVVNPALAEFLGSL